MGNNENIEYDIIQESIIDNEEILRLSASNIRLYYQVLKEKYMRVTGKTEKEVDLIFRTEYANFFDYFVKEINDSPWTWFEWYSTRMGCYNIKGILDDLRKRSKSKRVKEKLESFEYVLKITKIPVFVERKKDFTAEQTLDFVLKELETFLTDETYDKFITSLDSGLDEKGRSLVRKLVRKD